MSTTIDIRLPDGAIKKITKGTTPFEVAQSISDGLARAIISASYNGTTIEVTTPLQEDGELVLYSWKNYEGKKAFWHSSAHLLAQALEQMYPGIKLTIGPAIESGFYYDIDPVDHSISEKDLPDIEKRMIEIARGKHAFTLRSVSKSKALSFYKKAGNEYKTELVEGLGNGNITFCDHDNFSDLCRGGHIPNTGYIKAIKLTNIAGAYWRGNIENKQLTRIYGVSFPKQKLLTEHLELLEEAKKRDHRKLGAELGLFAFSKKVGQGLPLWLPKGAALRERLEQFLRKAQIKAGYEQVVTPHIGQKELYVTSGHYEKYGADSFQPINTPADGEEFLLKPMNCPHHCEIYNATAWSYRDLPIRYAEFGTVYRYEQSGELHGLTRARGFTQDDAHIFCTPDQLNDEFIAVIDLVLYVFNSLGFSEFKTQVSIRDPEKPEKYIGDPSLWEKAEAAIIVAAKQKGLDYTIEKGEAAFYGPKLDFMVKDALGRSWQLGTIQVDYNLPDRFDLTYKGKDNELHRPIMIHRAPFGSMERFVAILIEHTGGNFPIWLTPNQVQLLCVSEKYEKYAKKVSEFLENNEIRALVDNRNETIAKKIREAEMSKVPFMGIIGQEEVTQASVSIRKHGGENLGTMSLDEFAIMIKHLVADQVKDFTII
jgi:threonyl-tRNA synthetase